MATTTGKVRVLDTTLRDGDQAPGFHMKQEKKLWLAQKLDEAKVDIIEAGSAMVSDGERDTIKAIASAGLNAEILSFTRALNSDIDAAADCGVDGVHLVFPSSKLHIKEKLRKTEKEAAKDILACVEHAKDLGLLVELSAEDGSRADRGFLKSLFKQASIVGADRFCVCDTVGVLSPEKSFALFSDIKKTVGKKTLAVHCHNDLGLAVANTLNAIRGGATEFHATVNGVGERTGNAALEEVVVSLQELYGVKTIKTQKLYELSSFAKALFNFPLSPNKPLVGENAFSHESGIHVDGILKNPKTYEGIPPETVGRQRKILVGKLSG
ncbi:MAG: 2-isopropylmalate synthase, partial [Candidatus Micrarchaeia archaeon]